MQRPTPHNQRAGRNPVLLMLATFLLAAPPVPATPPRFTPTDAGLVIERVSAECPVIYDNDFWTDVPDAAYAWAQASAGRLRLRGNVITRCTFGWETKYAHSLDQQKAEAAKLFALAEASGIRNVPAPLLGAAEALRKPASGRVEDTRFERSAGSDLIVAEARRASPDRPLLVFCGGSCTTVASAYLTDPSIADRLVVFQIDGGAYNGSDGWAWEIASKRCVFANWAKGYFWDQVSQWEPAVFDGLPKNPLCDWLREYANEGLGKANQWGDGSWLYWLFDRHCLTAARDDGGTMITVPKEGTDVHRMQSEFIRATSDPAAYGGVVPSRGK